MSILQIKSISNKMKYFSTIFLCSNKAALFWVSLKSIKKTDRSRCNRSEKFLRNYFLPWIADLMSGFLADLMSGFLVFSPDTQAFLPAFLLGLSPKLRWFWSFCVFSWHSNFSPSFSPASTLKTEMILIILCFLLALKLFSQLFSWV